MYGGSFEPDALKKITMKALHTIAKVSGRGPVVRASLPIAWAMAAGSASIHGRNATARIATKYHHGSVRRCVVVRKRSKCSCTKKNSGNSRFATDTATNHGTAIARKSA